jgi:hypothetical protein
MSKPYEATDMSKMGGTVPIDIGPGDEFRGLSS